MVQDAGGHHRAHLGVFSPFTPDVRACKSSPIGRDSSDVSSRGRCNTAAIVRLVERARTGDSDAFEDLYTLYFAELCGYLFGLVRNPEDARDVDQQTFLQAWWKLPSLRDVTRFKNWLYCIARNAAYDYGRKEKKPYELSWDQLGGVSGLVDLCLDACTLEQQRGDGASNPASNNQSFSLLSVQDILRCGMVCSLSGVFSPGCFG
jgi:DNA-directed RNA polymerase specialized sigma24 family protein